ncbi:MAG: apolipoprotein N-acyltransferase [Deltaproteobacteria bacterium]|nr:MAG: apolipoprotein N-acyltransferase [Deltaproteobacteria bacterium]
MGLALLSGLLYALSLPGWGLWPLAWFSLLPLLVALRKRGRRDGLLLGLLAGTVASLGALYWVVVAVNRYGEIPLPLALPILLLLALYLGSYWGLFGLGATVFLERGGVLSSVGISALWVLLEFLRAHLLTGFPWGMLAHSQYKLVPLLQICDLTGAYGLSFLIALGNGALFLLLEERRPWGLVLFGALLLTALSYGLVRLKTPFAGGSIRVGVVQGNVDQAIKWDEARKRAILLLHRGLTLGLKGGDPRLVIWPETAFPGYFPEGELSQTLKEIPREMGAYFLFGALSREGGKVFNSAVLLSPSGAPLGRYDKLHLVPFGEFIPLRRYLEPLFGQLASLGDITPGEEMTVFRLPEGDFSVLICFEVIFPELARAAVLRGADFLVTITNDAWFGRTAAPYQHLAQVVFRAVENRVWFARAANTGISAIVDPWGRVLKATGIFTKEAFVAEVGIREGPFTLYCRWGDLFVLGCVGLFILSAWPRRPSRGRSSST